MHMTLAKRPTPPTDEPASSVKGPTAPTPHDASPPDGRPPDGPRERLCRLGAGSLSDAELLAVVLGTGRAGEGVISMAARLLHQVGGAQGLERLGAGALAQLVGVGDAKAARIVASIELGRRVSSRPLDRRERLTSSRAVDSALRSRLMAETREHLLAIALDAKNRPVAELSVAVGGMTACAVEPMDVFRALLREAAVSVILVHNHPSGDPEPSAEDIAVTDRLCRAGEILGITVVDHVIIAREGYFSFLDAGLLGRETPPRARFPGGSR